MMENKTIRFLSKQESDLWYAAFMKALQNSKSENIAYSKKEFIEFADACLDAYKQRNVTELPSMVKIPKTVTI